MRYDESTFAERHFPYSQFRNRVSKLEHLAKALLNDTLVEFLIRLIFQSKSHYTIVIQTTIVPSIDDIGFDPKYSMREMAGPSSSELDAFLIPSALSPNADGASRIHATFCLIDDLSIEVIPMSRFV